MSQARKGKTCPPKVPSTDPQSNLKQCNALQQEVAELKKKLNTELAKGSSLQNEKQALSQELSEMRTQWQRQKALKEMYINQGKETKRELESLRKYSNPENLCTDRIAAQVRNDIRQKMKKDLHKDYEELRVAYVMSQEKFKTELQAEREKIASLQEQLDRVSAVPQQVDQGHAPDAATVRQEADILQQQLEKEIQQKNVLLKHYEELQAEHKSSQEKFTAELQVEREKNKPHQEQMKKIKDVNCKCETDLINFTQQVGTLQRELDKEVQQRQLLEKDFQELQEAHTLSQQRFAAEIQVEEDKNKLLQENLESIRVSQQKVSDLRADLENVHQETKEKFLILQQDSLEKERCLVRELEELRSQLNFQITRNLELSSELKAQKESNRAQHEEKCQDEQLQHQQSVPQKHRAEPLNEAENNERKQGAQQESIPQEPDLKLLEEAAGSSVTAVSEELSPVTTRTPFDWERVCHFLGLRKPKRWRK